MTDLPAPDRDCHWALSWGRARESGGYRVVLEQRGLAPSTINQHLSAIRALVDEYGQNGLLDQATAAAITRGYPP